MREMTEDGRAARRIPVLAWVLVAGAAGHIGIWMAVNWYRVFGPYLILRVEDLSSIITGVAPFLLAAAVLIGAPRWPAGRGWLYAGAALIGIHGVMRTVADAWWAWRASDPIAPEGAIQVALLSANLIAVSAVALGPLCLATGLARVQAVRRMSPVAVAVIVLVGLAAVAAGAGLGAREITWMFELQSGDVATLGLNVAYRLLTTVGGVALVVLALAAVRARPLVGVTPEMLIAVGAVVAAAGLTASWAGQALLSIEAQSANLAWVWTLPSAVESTGKIILIAGFAVAGLGQRAPVARPTDGRPASTETVLG